MGHIPKRLLVLGGGIIGLEMATVYDALGSKVTIVELMDQIIDEGSLDRRLPLLEDLCEVMEDSSMCAMGSMTPKPVRSEALRAPPSTT